MIHKVMVHDRRGRAQHETFETPEEYYGRLVELSTTGYRLDVFGPVAHAWRESA